ncbi:hypothetical protein FRC02_002233 [Tulasnella sp. 418]|nr:hypothetical protein FRC02_002233 [Tulasnella sp. 418]
MLRTFTLLGCLLAVQITNVKADVLLFGQCGGIGYTGDIICAPPNVCTVMNPYYSQCLAPKSSTSTFLTTRTTSSSTSSKPSILTTYSATRTFAWPTAKPDPTRLCNATPVPVIKTTHIMASNSLYISQLLDNAAGLSAIRMPGDVQHFRVIAGGGGYIRTSCDQPWYLSVYESYPSTSYKPLVWTPAYYTNYWVVGDPSSYTGSGLISTTDSSPYGARSTFWACGLDKQLYLQTGAIAPPSTLNCKSVTLSIVISIW